MKAYRPSNGEEGFLFEERFCDRCAKRRNCMIQLDAMCFDTDEEEYPKEWVQDDDGKNERCTAFEKPVRKEPPKDTETMELPTGVK